MNESVNYVEISGEVGEEGLPTLLPGDSWKELTVPETVTIPEQKPDIEQLVEVIVKAKIDATRIVETPVQENGNNAVNNENDQSTGRKLIVEGSICQKIIYVGDVKEQSLHSASFKIPFSTFIVLPNGTPLDAEFRVDAFIEDVFIEEITEREVFKNITVFLRAVEIND